MFNVISLKKRDAIDISGAGRIFFAVAVVAFGIQHFTFGDFITGRAPEWPPNVSGKLFWAYFSGMVLIITGAAVVSRKKARSLLILSGTMIFFWALLRHVPLLIADFNWGGELTNAGKALTLFGGFFAVAGSLPAEQNGSGSRFSGIINQTDTFIFLGRFCLAIFMIISGIEHFIFLEFVKQLVPSWVPGNSFWTSFAGVALIAGGIGLMIRKTAPLAAILTGIMIFLWFVLLHTPRAVAINNQNEWIAVFESLAFSGIAFVLARTNKDYKI